MQIPRSIDLLRYRRYGADLLLLELVNASTGEMASKHFHSSHGRKEQRGDLSQLAMEPTVQEVWECLEAFLRALGDDVQMKPSEHYMAFRRLKNFACVKLRPSDLQVWAKVDPSSIELQEGFTRDVTQVGHLGTGNLEIRIQSISDLEKAKPLLFQSYQQS